MIRNPHTLEDSWWDGPERFQFVNRNVIASVQNENMFKYVKLFAPNKLGLHIGGHVYNGKRANYEIETVPYAILLNLFCLADITARAEQLPFKDEIFGYIVSFHTLEHIKGDVRSTLEEWLRVLVKNGIIAINMPDRRYFLHNPDVINEGEAAYHEMTSDELYTIVSPLNVDILSFDTRKNNFDFELIFKKI